MSEHKELMRNLRFVGGPIRMHIANSIGKLLVRAERAEAKVAAMKNALEFYADENNWRDPVFQRECEDYAPAEVWSDNGNRARKALEALGNG